MLDVSATTHEALSDAHCKVTDNATAHINRYRFDNLAHFGFQFRNVSRLIYVVSIFNIPHRNKSGGFRSGQCDAHTLLRRAKLTEKIVGHF